MKNMSHSIPYLVIMRAILRLSDNNSGSGFGKPLMIAHAVESVMLLILVGNTVQTSCENRESPSISLL